jgi:hypothetical protein
LPVGEKEIRLSYGEKHEVAFDIANFESNENWFGDGTFDYSTAQEGENSLLLTSLNGRKVTVSLDKDFNIKDVLNFKFWVYLGSDLGDIEEMNLSFSGQNFDYLFPIRELTKGWNLLILPKDKFSFSGFRGSGDEAFSIKKVAVELVSRPQARIIINLDSLWAEKDKDYLEDWNTDGEKFLSLKENKGKASLLASNLSGSRATLRKGSAKDSTFQAKFIPLKNGSFGLFLRGDYQSGYGYYLTMNGIDTNSWQITKYGLFEEKAQSVELARGEIANFKMEKDEPYWLKAELKGSEIVFYFSSNGKNFTQLGEVKDESFVSGGIGISVGGGMVLIDDLQFSQNQ